MEESIAWIHLSDLHSCNPRTGWDASKVKDELIKDIEKLVPEFCDPDLMCFTGDIAFGNIGDKENESLRDQYRVAAEFFESVLDVLPRVERRNVFIVPGNHDVNRKVVTTDQTAWLRGTRSKSEIEDMVRENTKQFSRIMERLEEYKLFILDSDLAHLLDDDARLVFAQKRQFQGVSIGIAGLNSSWSCCSDGEKGQLWLAGNWQIGSLRKELRGSNVSIALIHHPPSWFVEHEDNLFWSDVQNSFHFCLHGHEHYQNVESHKSGFTRIGCGACYDRSKKGSGYNLVKLDLVSKRLRICLRTYDEQGGGWIGQQIGHRTDSNGVMELSDLEWLNTLPRIHDLRSKVSVNVPVTPKERSDFDHGVYTPIRLSSSIHPNSVRRNRSSKTLFGYIKSVFVPERLPFLDVFTRDAKDFPEFESKLYVEPQRHVHKDDYVWRDAKRRQPDARFLEYTSSDELLAHVSDGHHKGIFLMGDIASGKSTFVNHFKSLFEKEISRPLCIMLDFAKWRGRIDSERQYRAMKGDCFDKLNFEIETVLREEGIEKDHNEFLVRNARHSSFKRFRRTYDYGKLPVEEELQDSVDEWQIENPYESVRQGFKFLKHIGFNILVIFDNVDPIPICYQEKFAQDTLELVYGAGIQVIVPLRFYSLESMANVAGIYRCCIFMRLDLPSIKDLIERRVKALITDRLTKEEYEIPTGTGEEIIRIHRDSLVKLLEYVNERILSSELEKTFLSISDLNIRFILQNYRAIIDSKHVYISPSLLYNFYERDKGADKIFNVKPHDLLVKSVVTERKLLFRYNVSRIENVFNTYSASRGDYFPQLLKLYLLEMFYRLSVSKTQDTLRHDFVNRYVLYEKLESFGWDISAISAAAEELYKKTLLFGYESDQFEFNTRLALSNSGYLYRTLMIRMVYYMFFMLFDFPLPESRILLYFDKKEIGDPPTNAYKLKSEFSPLFNDETIHILVGEFLTELVTMEENLVSSIIVKGAIKTFRNTILTPVSIRLTDSYLKHCKDRTSEPLCQCLSNLGNAIRKLDSVPY